MAARGGVGLTGRSLEGHVMGLAVTAKRLVALPGETPRRLVRSARPARKSAKQKKPA